MRLNRLFEEKKCVLAFEVFPPKKDSAVESVYGAFGELAKLRPDYISITYSAGGTGNKAYTAEIARHLKHDLGIEPLPHLTCYSATKEEVAEELAKFAEVGAENVMALRGDKAEGVPPGSDYTYASDLTADIARQSDFYIVGGCYPEGHPESKGIEEDIDALRIKLDAGVSHLVSQLFFDNGKFFKFLERAARKGIICPIEAGIMPIVRPEQVTKILPLSSASLPAEFTKLIARYEDDPAAFYEAGIDYSVRQIRELIENGIDGIHIYVMNKPDVAARICEGIADLL